MYTKKPKTVCQVIKEVKSWMEVESELEQQQNKQDEKYRDDNDIPSWNMMMDEDPTDMLYSI